MSSIDKAAVRRSFDQAARHYDAMAHLQRAVAHRLLAQAMSDIETLPQAPTRILDAGAGSGFGTSALARAFPHSHITAVDFSQTMLDIARNRDQAQAAHRTFVCGDVEALPFAQMHFDLVYCSSVLQWSDRLQNAIAELRRVMNDRALLLISIYTEGTLHELRNSWSAVDRHPHVLSLPSAKQLRSSLQAEHLHLRLCQTQNESVFYDDVTSLLKTLKLTGVRNLRRDRRRSLTPPAALERMKAHYRKHYAFGRQIVANYAVTFAVAEQQPVGSTVG